MIPNAVTGPTSRFTLIDLAANYKVNPRLTLGLNGDYFTQPKGAEPNGNTVRVKWQGVAGYATYQLIEKWQCSARAEIFDDVKVLFKERLSTEAYEELLKRYNSTHKTTFN